MGYGCCVGKKAYCEWNNCLFLDASTVFIVNRIFSTTTKLAQ